MSEGSEQIWLKLCRTEGIDPEEVRLVFRRYAAYRNYTDKLSRAIGLEQWFSFYHMEKSSERDDALPAPAGCSVDSGAVNNSCIKRPKEFLKVLRAYAESRTSC